MTRVFTCLRRLLCIDVPASAFNKHIFTGVLTLTSTCRHHTTRDILDADCYFARMLLMVTLNISSAMPTLTTRVTRCAVRSPMTDDTFAPLPAHATLPADATHGARSCRVLYWRALVRTRQRTLHFAPLTFMRVRRHVAYAYAFTAVTLLRDRCDIRTDAWPDAFRDVRDIRPVRAARTRPHSTAA